jgi:hypothetical protein
MKTRLLAVTVVFGLAHSVSVEAQGVVDACTANIPPAVARAVTHRFSDYRLPLVSDNLGEDVDFNRRHGGNGCLAVASADLNGDGKRDFAIGLRSVRGGVPLVAVALSRKDVWVVSTVKSWVDTPMRLYVRTVPPGVFRRTDALDGPLEPNERQSLRCSHSGIEVGATESTGIVYCYGNRRWLYVWVSD